MKIQSSKFLPAGKQVKVQRFSLKSKTFKILVTVLIFKFLLLTSSVYAAGATLSLSPSSGAFGRGCSFSVDINLNTGGAQTDGVDAILFYDPARLTATAIHSGTIYPDYPGNNIDPQAGKITVSGLSSVASAFTGSGVLASVDFTVAESSFSGITQVKFDFDPNDKAKTTDSNVVERSTVADVLNQVTNATFTVSSKRCGAAQGNTGNGDTGDVVLTKTPPVLPKSADFNTTAIVAGAGSFLILLGILGLALL